MPTRHGLTLRRGRTSTICAGNAQRTLGAQSRRKKMRFLLFCVQYMQDALTLARRQQVNVRLQRGALTMKYLVFIAALGFSGLIACSTPLEEESDDIMTSEDELVTPTYIGMIAPGPYRTYCNAHEAPPPCPGFQQKWVSCYHSPSNTWCKCNQTRPGNTLKANGSWYFFFNGSWQSAGLMDCR